MKLTPLDNEREFRQMISQKVSGTSIGIMLLIPELQRLGAWDIIKAWTGGSDRDIEPRIALQLVNESALCTNRIREKNSLAHQGFQLANGMGRLVTDEQIHLLLNKHTMEEAEKMFINLGHQRQLSGHYKGAIIAVDPHRIISSSKRVMAKKKKKPEAPSQKMLQTFFCVCSQTGQPIMATMSSTGVPTSLATKKLVACTGLIIKADSLLVADKEHFTNELLSMANKHRHFNFLIPAIKSNKLLNQLQSLDYKPLWPGYAIAESLFSFEGQKEEYRMISQREGEAKKDFKFDAFLTTSTDDAVKLITEEYDQRWSVEEFFHFENEMGLNRASTFNLNIRYAKLAFSMIAQASTYQLRQKLKQEYRTWNAMHLAQEILAWADGDIRVEEDKIIATFYGAPKHINPHDYINLPEILESEGINPKIPWMYDYKLDFRFK